MVGLVACHWPADLVDSLGSEDCKLGKVMSNFCQNDKSFEINTRLFP
jgi:hypothetical protein